MRIQKKLQISKLNIIVIICGLIFFIMSLKVSQAATTITPSENQYLELKATNIIDVDGKNKQVIMELWGYDIDFKRI